MEIRLCYKRSIFCHSRARRFCHSRDCIPFPHWVWTHEFVQLTRLDMVAFASVRVLADNMHSWSKIGDCINSMRLSTDFLQKPFPSFTRSFIFITAKNASRITSLIFHYCPVFSLYYPSGRNCTANSARCSKDGYRGKPAGRCSVVR